MASGHHGDEELRVDQTTPQGSQDNAVEFGHEERDTNVGGIMKWLIGTGILAVFTLGLVVGIFKVLDHVTDSQVKPSPMFVEAQMPPAPYIEGLAFTARDKHGIPIRGGDGVPLVDRAGMTEHLQDVREHESAELERWKMGESDPYMWHVPIEKDETKEVPDQPKGDEAKTDKMFEDGQLSDASGGLKDNPGR